MRKRRRTASFLGPWVPTANPVDIEQPDEALLAEVDRVWNQLRHVPVGGRMTDETATLEVARHS